MDIAPPLDFNFNSSPIIGSYYSSAPSSPTRLGALYCDFDELLIAAAGADQISSLAAVPFAWEEKPGVPKTPGLFQDEFSFDVSCDLGTGSVPAEDLFHGGRIKTADTPVERERGRDRGFSLPSSRSRRTRSLSPLGVSDFRREQQPLSTRITPVSAPVVAPVEAGSKRWSFKDLFLFRSASDGRAMDKYPLKKHFRSSGESGSVSKRRGRVSAHELHYNLNRANSNDMKKKTFLPYKQGILG
ncbi:hypothetical protein QVD17_16072 [Tagetes erecta]|uniref:Uncharacterized protein n=1 Tax=Tagetes erecta TaxID=13708 RepID=A0AAD8KRC0_TARER|nr:hypothetical protein QVD17_16072 [Tagetes erecta]